jgi:hypothetical protein
MTAACSVGPAHNIWGPIVRKGYPIDKTWVNHRSDAAPGRPKSQVSCVHTVLLQSFQLAVTQMHVLFEKRQTLENLRQPDDIAMYDRACVCVTWPKPS